MLPSELTYNNIKPKGWYTKFKEWPIYPASSNLYWTSNEIVRFLFQLTNGVMDPYRSHIEMQVETNVVDLPIGGVVMDVSGESLISQMVVSSNSREVERIPDYDVIAAYLFDMNFSEYVCENREWEGMGFDLQETPRRDMKTAYTSDTISKFSPTGATVDECQFSTKNFAHSMSPTKTSATITDGGQDFYVQPKAVGSTPNSYHTNGILQSTGQVSQHWGGTNYIWSDLMRNTLTANTVPPSGKLMNIRHEYQPEATGKPYIDSTTSLVLNNPLLTQGVIPNNWAASGTMAVGNHYSTYYPNSATFEEAYYNNGAALRISSIPTTCNLAGYTKAYSPAFSRGMNEPMLSPTIPQCQLSYGKVLDAPIPIDKKVFKISLLSAILGILIPVDQFVLIPLKVLNNLLIELTLNPYAMYSTGRKDVHELDTVGMATQIPRAFKISNVAYILHIYEFPQEEIARFLDESITKEIVITSSTWTLASQYQIATGSMVKNNWQINLSCESLVELCCLFLSNEYLKYAYCRKQFRLSNNITSMQLKFNVDYYPPQPIIGNAGCPEMVDNTGDNSEFLKQLLMSNNYLFSTNIPQPKINIYNFALNSRIYNPANVQPLYDPLMKANGAYVWTANSVNGDTAMGQSYFHENRHRGMAAYTYSFEPHNHSKNYMVGIDTRNVRPFDIMFDNASTNIFPTDQTLYIFARMHIVVVYNNNGVNVLGR